MTAEVKPDDKRGGASAVLRFLGLLVLGVIVAIGLLLSFPPLGLMKDRLVNDLSAATGRAVTIGDLKLRYDYTRDIDVELMTVAIANPDGMIDGNVLEAGQVTASVDLLSLLTGTLKLKKVNFVEPRIALEEAADGQRNWVIERSEADTENDVAAPTVDASVTQQAERPSILPPIISTEAGFVTFVSGKTGARRGATDVNLVLTLDDATQKASVDGNMRLNNALTRLKLAIADWRAVPDGTTSAIDLSLTAPLVRLALKGDASFAGAASYSGKIEGTSRSVSELAQWAGLDVAEPETPIEGSVSGPITATLDAVQFDGTDFALNTTSGNLDGALDISGSRPKLRGALNIPRLDIARVVGLQKRVVARAVAPVAAAAVEASLDVETGWDQLLTDLRALEADASGPAASRSLAPTAAARPERSRASWNDQAINLRALRALDLDLVIKADDIDYEALDLAAGEVHAKLVDGDLDADIVSLQMGSGQATGKLKINSRASPPKAELNLKLDDVAAEPIMRQLSGKPLLSGTSNVRIDARAFGASQLQLASTLEGKARFRLQQGALRGFDIRSMISQWWKRWSFDIARKTNFTRLDAQYDIKKGVLTSRPGLALGGSEVEINSSGLVDLPARRIDQDLRVKVVPPPTSWPIPVRISGSWSKPSISVDWGGLFSSTSTELNGPQGVAPAETPMPATVRAAIDRVLAADLPPERLSERGRSLLKSLIAPETAPVR